MEIWKDIAGYEGIYQVSNCGRVRSVDRIIEKSNSVLQKSYGKIRKTQIREKDGYIQVSLSKDGVHKTYKVHRLVAMAFLDNEKNLPEINHKDFDVTNNAAENLEWCTGTFNLSHRRPPARRRCVREKRWYGPDRRKKIAQKDKFGETIEIFDSISDAAKKNGFDDSSIAKVAKGKAKSYKGYCWEYV